MLAARVVAFFENRTPQVVLAHYGDATPETGADFCCNAAFAGCGIAAQYNQPREPRGIASDARRVAGFDHMKPILAVLLLCDTLPA